MKFQKTSVPFAPPPELPEFLVEWKAPDVSLIFWPTPPNEFQPPPPLAKSRDLARGGGGWNSVHTWHGFIGWTNKGLPRCHGPQCLLLKITPITRRVGRGILEIFGKNIRGPSQAFPLNLKKEIRNLSGWSTMSYIGGDETFFNFDE